LAINVILRDVEQGDVEVLSNNLREADRDELEAATSIDVHTLIKDSVEMSTYTQTGLIDDELVCMWGVCPISMIGRKGSPWMLSTTLIEKYPLTFLKRCKPVVKKFTESYTFLENHVDVRNTVAIHWLKWLGFKFDEPKPWGIKGMDFQRFSMEKE